MDKDIEEVAFSIKRSRTITDIDLSNNSISQASLEIILKSLADKILYINLKNNNIGTEGVKLLAYSIPYIEILNISGNNIDADGGKYIGIMIEKCLVLKCLSIGNNNIKNAGIGFVLVSCYKH